jgi:hypothetical protein
MARHFLDEYGDDTSIDEGVSNFLEEMSSNKKSAPNDDDDDDDLEEQMDDVELRIEVASCYRQLLKSALFEDATDASRIVEKRLRAFAKADMRRMLGMYNASPPQKAPVEPIFAPEVVEVLKRVAAGIMSKAGATRMEADAERPPALAQIKATDAPTIAKTQAPKVSTVAPLHSEAPRKKQQSRKQAAASPPPQKDGIIGTTATERPGEQVIVKRKGGRVVREYVRNGHVVASQNVTEVRNSVSTPKTPMPTQEQQAILSVAQANADLDATMRRRPV